MRSFDTYLAWSRAGDHDRTTGTAAMAYGAVQFRDGVAFEHWGRGAEKNPDDMLAHATCRFGNDALIDEDNPKLNVIVEKPGVMARLKLALIWLMGGQPARDRGRDINNRRDNASLWMEAKRLAAMSNLEIRGPKDRAERYMLQRAREIARRHAAEALRLKQHLVRGIAETDEGTA